jgi:hypothetical protein
MLFRWRNATSAVTEIQATITDWLDEVNLLPQSFALPRRRPVLGDVRAANV